MSSICDINTGVIRACKTHQGGIDKVYLFPFVKYSRSQIEINGVFLNEFPVTEVFDFDVVNEAYTESSNNDSGGVFYSQNLSFDIPVTTPKSEAYKLVKKDYRAIILDRLGNYRILGLYNGLEASLTNSTGSNKKSLNGYKVTLKGKEENQAHFLTNFSKGFDIFDPKSFTFKVQSGNTGTSNNDQFTITVGSGSFAYNITTEDGYSATGLTGDNTITFPNGEGEHTVKITGVFPAFDFTSAIDNQKITDISNFGIYGLGSTDQEQSFYQTSNLTISAADTGNFQNVTNFQNTWKDCTSLTSFPVIDTSSGTQFQSAWKGCTSLTSFPTLNVINATSFNESWKGCTSLVSFPKKFFDNCTARDLTEAFKNTNLSSISIDNILRSLDTASQLNGTFDQSGGQAPSAVGLAAKTSLEAKGWTISVTT
tara:strand:+ start:1408 stop:2682 length:1275 start_codon:yes stop_codon:yes gene_type:complete